MDNKKYFTHGIRRKSIKSMSDVIVKTAVMLIARPFCFFPFEVDDFSVSRPHSIVKVTSTGPFPLLDSSSISLTFNV